MIMKKVGAVVGACVLALGLTACGGDKAATNPAPVVETTKEAEKPVEKEEVKVEVVEEKQEEVSEVEVADITDAMVGVWVDHVGDLYGFYEGGVYEGYWVEEDVDVAGEYALVTDGDVIALALSLGEEVVTYEVTLDMENNAMVLMNVETGEVAALTPYEEEAELADISEFMVGVWADHEGNVYGFYEDGSYEGYNPTLDAEITGEYALITDGADIALSITAGDSVISFYVEADEENNALLLIEATSGDVAALSPIE